MAAKQVMAARVFPNHCEANYDFRSRLDHSDYPQVHDFYEITLIISGTLKVDINDNLLTLKKGDLLFLRPYDVHEKLDCGPCQHINLAFPAYTMKALFDFLYDTSDKITELKCGPYVPICSLSGLETTMLHNRLSSLNLMPFNSIQRKNTYLRTILTEIMSSYIMAELERQKKRETSLGTPSWLLQALDGLSDIKNLEAGMDYLTAQTNRTPEHICRSFRKYMNMSPMTYINAKRLNYAANLLHHSDKDIIDIAYESGFQSLSHFYHLFKKEYQSSPLKYKNQQFIGASIMEL